MENKNAFLPYFITEDIYVVSDEVVEIIAPIEEVKEVAESAPEYIAPPIKYKGENRKGILILVENNEGEYLSSEDEIFLSKILHAVGIQLDDIALVNVNTIEGISQFLEIKHTTVIAFTTKYAEINEAISNELYQIKTQEKVQILLAHPLHEISQEKEKKIKLWKQLQDLF